MFKGVFTPVVTFFDQQGNIDITAMELLITSLVDAEVDGIVLFGTIGEFYSVSLEEKKNLIKCICDKFSTKTKIIVGTSDNDIEKIIELNNFCCEVGTNATLILSPCIIPPSQQDIFEYYDYIAKNSHISIFLYSFPLVTQQVLSEELVLRLAKANENIVGIKDSNSSGSSFRKYIIDVKKNIARNFYVLNGFEEYMLSNMLSGGDGVISGLSNINPKLFVNFKKAIESSDFELTKKLHYKVMEMMALYDLSSSASLLIKEVLHDHGIPNSKTIKSGTNRINKITKQRAKELIEKSL